MGTLIHITGNLFDTRMGVIAHGCNCRGVYGAGIALQVRKRYPEAYQAYMRKHKSVGWHLGDVQYVEAASGFLVVNMATQDTYGRTGRHVDYGAVRTCFQEVLAFCEGADKGLAIPKVGCNLGGGDWTVVEGIIVDCLRSRQVDVEVYSL